MPRQGGHRPVTDDEKDRIFALHSDGWSRNAIAKELGRSGRTISRICDELGLRFDRHLVSEAVEAKKIDARARRAALALQLLDDVDELRARLHSRYEVYQFDKEGCLNTGTLDKPPARDQRDLMMAIGAAVDRSLRLDEYDADPGIDAAKSMLGALAKGLGAAYDQLNQPNSADGD